MICDGKKCAIDGPGANGPCKDEGSPTCSIDRCLAGSCEHTELLPLIIPSPDPEPLDQVDLTPDTLAAWACLQQAVLGAGGTITMTSGFRSALYQRHLQEVFDSWKGPPIPTPPFFDALWGLESWNEAECSQVSQSASDEFRTHAILRRPVDCSDHTAGTGFDAAWRGLPTTANIDVLAKTCSWIRPGTAPAAASRR